MLVIYYLKEFEKELKREKKMKENLLDLVAYHKKWHSKVQNHRKKYIYNTNDYLIEEIFSRLKITDGVFVEFGAWDGVHLSNTKKLFDNGWRGLLIEPDNNKFKDLENNYKDTDRVICIKRFLDTKENLIDDIFEQCLEENIDFCSIDIDGLDLDIFETFKINLPKVVCIEGGQILEPNYPRISSELSSNNIQQSLSVMNDVFESKGYKLLCAYQDAFFIKEEYFHLFNVDESLYNQYIEGLIVIPRLPYIKSILDKHGLTNNIIEKALSDVPNDKLSWVMHQADAVGKQQWVDEYYESIKSNLESLKE